MRGCAALAGTLAAIVIAGAMPATASALAAPSPCGQAVHARPDIRHVIIIVMENRSSTQVIGHAPFMTTLAHRCGLATNYHAITHPSLPNYLAMTSGSTHGIRTDCEPAQCWVRGPNVFTQASRHGLRWRSYAESMPRPCYRGTTTLYAARHVPAVYYRRIHDCGRHVRKLGKLTRGHLHFALHSGHAPALMFVTPNMCNDMHDCSLRRGDTWLSRWIPMIVRSPTYRHGHTAVLLTFDEGGGGGKNIVPLIVLSRYTPVHAVRHRLLTHYSLLRATEKMLGIRRYLGKARSARGLPKAFHL
jgi:phospholipase C